MPERRAATTQLFATRVPLTERVTLLRRYGVRHLYARQPMFSHALLRSFAPVTQRLAASGAERILVLSPSLAR
jgi:hypothetical protein